MWEILVPCEMRRGKAHPGKTETMPIKTRYHRVWDEKVRAITGGLTILPPAKGQWVSPSGELFAERMIPVRIVATWSEIQQIIDMTMDYYNQEAVLAYVVSNQVIIKHRKGTS